MRQEFREDAAIDVATCRLTTAQWGMSAHSSGEAFSAELPRSARNFCFENVPMP